VGCVTSQLAAERYQRLDSSQVVGTTMRLQRRVSARFPERGLARVAGELAHIVDMHQLTKDPERLRPGFTTTSETVDVHLATTHAMENYLDYCSEMLSLIGKVAALCAEESQDPVILDTVSTIETLTTGMSRKIWQKISLLPDR
jgi:hypothetical protein